MTNNVHTSGDLPIEESETKKMSQMIRAISKLNTKYGCNVTLPQW